MAVGATALVQVRVPTPPVSCHAVDHRPPCAAPARCAESGARAGPDSFPGSHRRRGRERVPRAHRDDLRGRRLPGPCNRRRSTSSPSPRASPVACPAREASGGPLQDPGSPRSPSRAGGCRRTQQRTGTSAQQSSTGRGVRVTGDGCQGRHSGGAERRPVPRDPAQRPPHHDGHGVDDAAWTPGVAVLVRLRGGPDQLRLRLAVPSHATALPVPAVAAFLDEVASAGHHSRQFRPAALMSVVALTPGRPLGTPHLRCVTVRTWRRGLRLEVTLPHAATVTTSARRPAGVWRCPRRWCRAGRLSGCRSSAGTADTSGLLTARSVVPRPARSGHRGRRGGCRVPPARRRRRRPPRSCSRRWAR